MTAGPGTALSTRPPQKPEEASAPTALERVFYPSTPEPWTRKALLSPLSLLSWTYGGAVRLRGALYDTGLLRAEPVEGLRVVSVGNLNVGGTGKTPAVLHLAEMLIREGRKVGILTRGYGRESPEPVTFTGSEPTPEVTVAGDEPLLLARRCPQARLFVGADRVAAARRARDDFGLDTVLLDDGFQHRRLHRDEDLVVVDEAVGLGNGHLLPRGPLREPPSALRRATLLWLRAASLSSGPTVPIPWLEAVTAPRVRTRYGPTGWWDASGTEHATTALEGRPVLVLAGLARPGGFLRTVTALGAQVRDAALFPDHHRFTADELRDVAARARREGALVVTTEKDAVRLPQGFEAWVVRLGVEVLEGEPHLRRALGLPEKTRDL
ncbi:tetraacyldisaccharide 4'-kinase [Corallococcus praedator]|uniref:Tetraacyldisaccharide 4'-kinase n=1 Tax=Corallococcus praedator TaxID=2316724 RepID=A0ABX9QDD8_9BACT|nr:MULTISPECIES: tetraacyldisaccharide 4'-kinase [Corallococcus]RKH23362.1 tetraacyldisaccharide 4'-kinase [Corallococcus sp. CA031C]RKI01134.1 tetraacyldisaccharide 4'-kinase [Corallococcus praedator]